MIIIVAESGAGKTTIEDYLIENYGFKRAISHTSRAKRVNDVEGVNYFFVSKEEMERLYAEGELIERIDYMGEIYGFVKGQCLPDRIAVVTPDGLEQLSQHKDLNIVSFYLRVTPETRRSRMLGRGDSPESVEKRLYNDNIVFAGAESMVDFVLENDKDKTVEDITKEILGKVKD